MHLVSLNPEEHEQIPFESHELEIFPIPHPHAFHYLIFDFIVFLIFKIFYFLIFWKIQFKSPVQLEPKYPTEH